MKVQIKDKSTFTALNPAELAGYLRATAWKEINYREDHSSLWQKDYRGETAELIVPLNRRFGDYSLRMADAVALIAAIEDRSQLAVLDDIHNSSMDVVRIQLGSADAEQGSISVERGVAMFDGIPELFSASACAAQHPRVYFPTKKTKIVSDYLRQLRFGQTEAGSYVIRVLAPVPPPLPELFGAGDEPFEREVIVTLLRGLAALRKAADQTLHGGSGKAFEEAIRHGVSVNLCEAFVNIFGAAPRPDEILSLRVTPARNRPLTTPLALAVNIQGDRVPIIREAARVLKASAPLHDQEIQGYVVKLQAKDDGGFATVSTYIDGQPRKVMIALTEAEHKKAIQAYEQRAEIACRGDLTRSGQLWSLPNPGPITLLRDE